MGWSIKDGAGGVEDARQASESIREATRVGFRAECLGLGRA